MSVQTPEVHAVFHSLIEQFESAFTQGDAAGIASFYTENAMLLPPEADFVKGRQAIQAFWQMAIDMGIKGLKLDVIDVELHGDTAIEMSKYTLGSADNEVMEQGKGIVIWKSVGGVWKLHRDIWNSSATA